MATPIVRMFETEEQARDAAARLRDAGFYDDVTFVLTPPGAEEVASTGMLANAVQAGRVLGDVASFYLERLHAGRTLVVVEAPVGRGGMAAGVLDRCGPADMAMTPPVEPDPWGGGAPLSSTFYIPVLMKKAPAPFSRGFGLPMLTHGTSTFGTLASSDYSFTGSFGLPMLSKVAAPLSSLISFGTLIRNAMPLSSLIGMTGLSRSASPLSSLLGLPTLSRNGAPLSSLCSLPLLAQPR